MCEYSNQSQFGTNNLTTVTLEDKGVLCKQKSGITSTFPQVYLLFMVGLFMFLETTI